MPKKSKKRVAKKTAQKRKLTTRLFSLRAAIALGAVFVLFGIFLIGFQLFNIWRAQQTTAAPQPISNLFDNSGSDDNHAYLSDNPIRVIVPSVSIDLKVIPGYYDEKSNSW